MRGPAKLTLGAVQDQHAGAWPSTWHAGAMEMHTPGDDVPVHSNDRCFDGGSRNECWCRSPVDVRTGTEVCMGG
jgi:hypothetical protein